MNDEELKTYFWQLAQQVVDPLLEYGRTHTTPSIERSVLLRMGFSSLEAKPLVEYAIANDLIGHGVGNVVYLSEGQDWDKAAALFEGGAANG